MNKPKHTFDQAAGIQLSTDYCLLWDLIFKGNRIPAWIVYTDKYEEPIWDLVEVKKAYMSDGRYSIGSRGIGYEGKQTKEFFINLCERYSMHFICPIKDTKQVNIGTNFGDIKM